MTKYGNFIEIDGSGFENPQLFETTVLNLLKEISRKRVGLLVLYEVKNSGHTLKIRPAKSLMDSRVLSLSKTENGVKIAMGGTTVLRFSPGNYDPQSGKFVDIEPFFDADDVLLHELWHAARAMQGLSRLELTGDEYDDLEEFFAVLVSNVYLSETGRNHRLRAGHVPSLIVKLRLNSAEFWMKYTERILRLKLQAPIFFNLMAQLNCLFNPFHDDMLHFQGMTSFGWRP
jgi:hypothetical protein